MLEKTSKKVAKKDKKLDKVSLLVSFPGNAYRYIVYWWYCWLLNFYRGRTLSHCLVRLGLSCLTSAWGFCSARSTPGWAGGRSASRHNKMLSKITSARYKIKVKVLHAFIISYNHTNVVALNIHIISTLKSKWKS